MRGRLSSGVASLELQAISLLILSAYARERQGRSLTVTEVTGIAMRRRALDREFVRNSTGEHIIDLFDSSHRDIWSGCEVYTRRQIASVQGSVNMYSWGYTVDSLIGVLEDLICRNLIRQKYLGIAQRILSQ